MAKEEVHDGETRVWLASGLEQGAIGATTVTE